MRIAPGSLWGPWAWAPSRRRGFGGRVGCPLGRRRRSRCTASLLWAARAAARAWPLSPALQTYIQPNPPPAQLPVSCWDSETAMRWGAAKVLPMAWRSEPARSMHSAPVTASNWGREKSGRQNRMSFRGLDAVRLRRSSRVWRVVGWAECDRKGAAVDAVGGGKKCKRRRERGGGAYAAEAACCQTPPAESRPGRAP